jgi:Tfp pilus assembly protein PilF
VRTPSSFIALMIFVFFCSPLHAFNIEQADEFAEAAARYLPYEISAVNRGGELSASIAGNPSEASLLQSAVELAYRLSRIGRFEKIVFLFHSNGNTLRKITLESDLFRKWLSGQMLEEDFVRSILSEEARAESFSDPGVARKLEFVQRELENSNLLDAERDVDSVLSTADPPALSWLFKGYCRFLSGDHSAALKNYSKAAELGLDEAVVCRYVGSLYLANGESEKAAAELEKAMESSRDSDVLYNYALALFDLGRKEEASKAIEEALGKSPGDPDYLLAAGEILEAAGNLPRAKELLGRAMEAGDKRSETLWRYALLTIKEGDSTGESMLRALVESDPSFLPALVSLVDILRKTKRDAEASRLLDKLDPIELDRSKWKEEADLLRRFQREASGKK